MRKETYVIFTHLNKYIAGALTQLTLRIYNRLRKRNWWAVWPNPACGCNHTGQVCPGRGLGLKRWDHLFC